MAISDKLILIAFVALAIGTVNGQAETGVRGISLAFQRINEYRA